MAGHVYALRSYTDALQAYVTRVSEGDYRSPSDLVHRIMSQLIDASANRVYLQAKEIMDETDSLHRAVSTLRAQRRTCGHFTSESAILEEYTPFEQMCAIDLWFEEYGAALTRQQRTLTFAAPDGSPIPIRIKPPKTSSLSTKHVIIGSTSGVLKAPRYTDWEEVCPIETEIEHFVHPLDSLEMVRQPHCIGALLLKANPYERRTIAHDWRYKVFEKEKVFAREASVELPKQSDPKVVRHKEQSAGFNLTKIIATSRYLRGQNLLPDKHYEDYFDEGYDDNIPCVSPRSIVRSLPSALAGETAELDALVAKLFAAQLGIPSIGPLQSHLRSVLFDPV